MAKTKEKIITKKSFIVITAISFIVANIADLVDAVVNNTFIGGRSGFPFKDSLSGGLEGGGTSYNNMFILNVLFWFIVIFAFWRLLLKILKK